MSTNIKTPTIEDLVQQLSDVRQALQDERTRLVERIATIDQALAVSPSVPRTVQKPKTPKPATGIRQAIGAVLASSPNLTIRQIQEATREHPPKSVEATVRAMASEGKLAKDESSPKKFSLPTKANGKS